MNSVFGLIEQLRKSPHKMQQNYEEAMALYSLVLSRKPQNILEIGVRNGGSAILMAHALDHLQEEHVVVNRTIDAVDANGEIPESKWSHLARNRINLIRKNSPEGVPVKQYDLIHIDGNHNTKHVLADLNAAMRCCDVDSRIILHDANFPGVIEALEAFEISHAQAHVHYKWTVRTDREDNWGGQALITFKRRT